MLVHTVSAKNKRKEEEFRKIRVKVVKEGRSNSQRNRAQKRKKKKKRNRAQLIIAKSSNTFQRSQKFGFLSEILYFKLKKQTCHPPSSYNKPCLQKNNEAKIS